MLEFKRMTLADLDELRPYIVQSRTRSCDDTIADVFMWRDYFEKYYCIVGDSLIIKMKYFNLDEAYMLPLGGDTKAALEALAADCRERGVLPAFAAVTKDRIPEIEAVFGQIEIEGNRDWADYIYDAGDFIQQKGKKFSSQRNHVNRFIRSYPGYHFTEITAEHIEPLKAFFAGFDSEYNKDNAMVAEETIKIHEILDNYDTYGMSGAILSFSDMEMILGFTIGEVIGDTLFVHVEKARTDIPGVYPVMSQNYAAMMESPDIQWINREEDLGDPGLRRSKEGYNPAYLLDKHSVKVLAI